MHNIVSQVDDKGSLSPVSTSEYAAFSSCILFHYWTFDEEYDIIKY